MTLRRIAVLTLLGLYTPGLALANGRFPKAQQIATIPGGDGSTIFLRSTFGLLVSRDAGKSWSWTCEQAIGFSGTWDPPIAVTKDGRVWAGLPDGLHVTRDGCDVREVPELKGELVADISVEPGEGRAIVVTSTPDKPAHVWRQKAAGGAFERLGKGVTGVSFDTIDVAPSKASRIYATAAPVGGGKRAHLFRSDDGGATLNELDVHLEKDGRLFLSAIDPKDDARVFVRHTNESGTDLLLSTDAGATFKVVLHTKTSMFGFARSADGATYVAGAGDATEGVFVSKDRGVTWEKGARTSVLCLHADGARLYACSNPYALGGWAVALSTDLGASFRPLATFEDVRGAVSCDAGAGAQCTALWPEVHAQISIPAQASDASVAPPGASDEGGVAPVAASTADAGNVTLPAKRACGCAARGRGAPCAGVSAILLAALALARRLDRR